MKCLLLIFLVFSFLAQGQNAYQIGDYRLDSVTTIQTSNFTNNISTQKYLYTDQNQIKSIEYKTSITNYEYQENEIIRSEISKSENAIIQKTHIKTNSEGYTQEIKNYSYNHFQLDSLLFTEHSIYTRNEQNQILSYKRFTNMDVNIETLELTLEIKYSYIEDLLQQEERIVYNILQDEKKITTTTYEYDDQNLRVRSEKIYKDEYPDNNIREVAEYKYNQEGRLVETINEVYHKANMDVLLIKDIITAEYFSNKTSSQTHRYNFDTQKYDLTLAFDTYLSDNPFLPFELQEVTFKMTSVVREYITEMDMTEDPINKTVTVRRDSRTFVGSELSTIRVSKSIYKRFDNSDAVTDTLIHFKIFPNPVLAGNPIKLESSSNAYNGFEIFSNDGKLITRKEITGTYFNSLEAPMNAGVYYLRFLNDETPVSDWHKMIVN